MARSNEALRRPALEGRAASHAWVSVTPAAPASRLSLRTPADSVGAVSKALGFALPQKPKTSAQKNGRAALWLGPDEWLVIDESGSEISPALGKVKAFHSAVDVSHRNVGIVVSGPGAEATIAAGCPQDILLATFPVGACSRTVLGKIEIVLWRTGDTTFRVECWRSFSDYAFTFLSEAARDAAV
ncbi:sarcosine oxidase subunit gamma family protein [Mesorhizobium microcysteis]|uniref:Sarcosine oxidase subunit gamma family protein n=1 Tax=Neoaquamicrobium microcysteis TaxID=2682781 RepID=A0A5D4GPI1_9HYPH|nr:sarcosine oxidase subunit gamma [Mesorhizobium microcysteis]TYR30218.1 sarcosine oxidase subunit gamma family protein [Mesorhizobium microcysteis]